ncbi:MAG: transcriptional repressor [Chloroflexi bacterium]|nr:transcriptional repressor [Chloroflexota bacterium]
MSDPVVVGERRLRAAGKRITPQRKLVLNILAEVHGHLDANDIYERARRRGARTSLSTIYRTLGVLKETGVVRELHLDGEQHHYELDGKDGHSHLVCLACGRVIEIDSTAFATAAKAAADAYGFQVASAQMELAGYCADCYARRQNQKSA